jgi:hypothetical protein
MEVPVFGTLSLEKKALAKKQVFMAVVSTDRLQNSCLLIGISFSTISHPKSGLLQ